MDFDLSQAVLALHVLVGMVFVGLGVQNYVAAQAVTGLVLNVLLGLLIIGLGVGLSRIVD